MFLTISYISNAVSGLTSDDIETLMVDTKLFNNQHNIRGILIYVDQTFSQIIEGEYDKTMSLFKRIEKDNRHYNVLKMLETKSTQRKFERFNGNYITYNSQQASAEFLKFLEVDNESLADQNLHDLIVCQSKVLLNQY